MTQTTFGPYPAVVDTIHDGDTLTLDIDLGFNITFRSACRIWGINAPELATDPGKTALVFAETLLQPGDKVTVLSRGWDKYGGRFDGSVTLPDGRDFGQVMVDAGQAKPYFGVGPKE
jgi:endonuclease YncB( thermonuclease family)